MIRAERKAINNLKNRGLIINSADKGSTIVVQDRESYTENAKTKHLNDTTVYKKLTHNPTEQVKENITSK